ncbi:unnamed protein product [Amoebophrya sp. A120]|nr:unnamed protein product [Amoebophrya sp. A120]|eukprot:GSA120T00006465001.1
MSSLLEDLLALYPTELSWFWALFGCAFYEFFFYLSRRYSQLVLVKFSSKPTQLNTPLGGKNEKKHCGISKAPSGCIVDKFAVSAEALPCTSSPTCDAKSVPTETTPCSSSPGAAFYAALPEEKKRVWDMNVVSLCYATCVSIAGFYQSFYPGFYLRKSNEGARYDGMMIPGIQQLRSLFGHQTETPSEITSAWTDFVSVLEPHERGSSSTLSHNIFSPAATDEAFLFQIRRAGVSEPVAAMVSFSAGIFLVGAIREYLHGGLPYVFHHVAVCLNAVLTLRPFFLYWCVYLMTWEVSNIPLSLMLCCDTMPEFKRSKTHGRCRIIFFLTFVFVRIVLGTPMSYLCLKDFFRVAFFEDDNVASSPGDRLTAQILSATSVLAFGLNAFWSLIILYKGAQVICGCGGRQKSQGSPASSPNTTDEVDARDAVQLTDTSCKKSN